MTGTITYRASMPAGAQRALVPGGIATPHGRSWVADVGGATVTDVREDTSGASALVVAPAADTLEVTYGIAPEPGSYPDAIFVPGVSRYTRFADALAQEALAAADGTSGADRARAIACHTAARFTYGHPLKRFNDGLEEVPALGCGLFEGSCVDINTYFIAALRAAGIEAGYVTGFFFPQEKDGTCTDGHCWVVTRTGGAVLEWDIAHHLKLGTRDIFPALDPKPGRRVACFHSMGLSFSALGLTEIKALTEPVALTADGIASFETPEIRLRRAAVAA